MAHGPWRDSRRELFLTEENTNQDSSGNSETEVDPTDPGDEDLNRDFQRVLEISEEQNGEWLPHHPWSSENKPDPNLKMKDTVTMSLTYPLSSEWIRPRTESSQSSQSSQDVDLVKVFSCLPRFTQSEMKGSINGSRQELEQLVHRYFSGASPVLHGHDLPPHTREIVDGINQDYQNDKQSLPSDRHLKATSIESSLGLDYRKAENNFYINCEYTLNMYAKKDCLRVLTWFDVQQCDYEKGQIQWIRKIRYNKKEKRWIFIPSFRRAKIALLQWPEDDIVTDESTIRILVVRPSEFEEYVKYCGHLFPIICLPQDEIGAGYPRYWIQKIALRLKLQFIWMIDDSVKCFYEYHPEQEPPEHQDRQGRNYRDYRRRLFGLVFERIEDIVKEADDNVKPIAAMSPRRWNPPCRPKTPFSCMPPQAAVYLNLRALSEKNVYYRPELKTFEDMIFGYECEQKGLKVYRDNRILLKDHNWKGTGASSPSVKSK